MLPWKLLKHHIWPVNQNLSSVFFTCQVSAYELQPFSCHDLANEIYSQTAKTVFSHLNLFRRCSGSFIMVSKVSTMHRWKLFDLCKKKETVLLGVEFFFPFGETRVQISLHPCVEKTAPAINPGQNRSSSSLHKFYLKAGAIAVKISEFHIVCQISNLVVYLR